VPRALLAALALCCALAGGAPSARAAVAQVTIQVPAGKAKVVRLRNLPRGTQIGVLIDASGRLVVGLRSATQIKTKSADAVFRGALERKLTFEVSIPESDDYYLVLDNRRGAEPVKVTATIEAVARKKKAPSKSQPQPAPGAPKGGKFDETRAAGAARA
jgi:hypothetical protein